MMKPFIKREAASSKQEKQDKDKYRNIEDNVHTRSLNSDYYLTV